MNETIRSILNRRSVRAFQERPIPDEERDLIVRCAMRAPTAGNMMLYSIIEIADRTLKEKLARSCDNQPFIAKSPLVLIFAADYQRWFDYFIACGVEDYCTTQGIPFRRPGVGDFLLACCDALIAAQTAVLAAESLGIGSCYIGDIMEHYEYHRKLLNLPRYVFPVTMLCFGYPKPSATRRPLTPRFSEEYIHFTDEYRRLGTDELQDMFSERERPRYPAGAINYGQAFFARKFGADFAVEMNRSVAAALEAWRAESTDLDDKEQTR